MHPGRALWSSGFGEVLGLDAHYSEECLEEQAPSVPGCSGQVSDFHVFVTVNSLCIVAVPLEALVRPIFPYCLATLSDFTGTNSYASERA